MKAVLEPNRPRSTALVVRLRRSRECSLNIFPMWEARDVRHDQQVGLVVEDERAGRCHAYSPVGKLIGYFDSLEEARVEIERLNQFVEVERYVGHYAQAASDEWRSKPFETPGEAEDWVSDLRDRPGASRTAQYYVTKETVVERVRE